MRESEKHLSGTFTAMLSNGECEGLLPSFQHVVPEMRALLGIPDFVASQDECTITPKVRDWLSTALSRPSVAKIVSLLKRRAPRTEEFLIRKSGYSRRLVLAAISDLEAENLVARKNGSGIILSERFPDIDTRLWAFEMKVEDWTRAFRQALRYQVFAERVAVVISASSAHRAEKNKDLFDRFNVGLFALDSSARTLREIVKPRRCRRLSPQHVLFAHAQFWGALNPNDPRALNEK